MSAERPEDALQAEELWFPGIEADPDLAWIARSMSSRSADHLVGEAFQMLESRIRSAAGLPTHLSGIELIDQAFEPSTGVLQPVSSGGAERAGFHQLIRGVFLLYHGAAQRRSYLDRESARIIIHLVNHALHLTKNAADTSVQIDRYFSSHEGLIRYRRDFRYDVDGDTEVEIISLVTTSNVVAVSTSEAKTFLRLVVLDLDDGELSRLDTEPIEGISLYGGHRCSLEYVTSRERPDIVTGWSAGENGEQVYIFRWNELEAIYKIIQFDLGEIRHPNTASTFTALGGHNLYDSVQFVDFDGDGLVEVVQSTAAIQGLEDINRHGIDIDDITGIDAPWISRVWKWDSQHQIMKLVDEVAR